MNKHAAFAIPLLVTLTGYAAVPEAAAQNRATPPSAAPRAATPQAAAPRPATPSQAAPSSPAEDGSAVKGGEVVARVGDSDVTAEEVRAALASLDARRQAAVARDPALLSQTVRAILANRLVLREAQIKKWDQQPSVVAQLARARENLIVESYLNSVTMPAENYPAEADIKNVYDANIGAFLVPRRFQLAQIVVTVAKDADKAADDAGRKIASFMQDPSQAGFR